MRKWAEIGSGLLTPWSKETPVDLIRVSSQSRDMGCNKMVATMLSLRGGLLRVKTLYGVQVKTLYSVKTEYEECIAKTNYKLQNKLFLSWCHVTFSAECNEAWVKSMDFILCRPYSCFVIVTWYRLNKTFVNKAIHRNRGFHGSVL